MSEKVLFVASTHKHFRAFHIPYIQLLKELGCEVHVAANDGTILIQEADRQFVLTIERNPTSLQNLKAIGQLRQIIRKNGYDLVHCHTAMGAVVGRLAARYFRGQGTKVLYTAHGFHFFKNAPLHYWWLYYPIEKYLSRFTDGLILINREDYSLVNRRNFKQVKSYLIPGIGVKSDRFNPVSKEEKFKYRRENGLSPDDFLLVYAAEYIKRKNHNFILNSARDLIAKIPNLKILFAGRGKLFDKVKVRVEKEQLQNQVLQLGFRKDIDIIYKMADVGISASKQEGLGLNLIEEMMCGLPVVATNGRGHNEVIDHGVSGFLFKQGECSDFVNKIYKLFKQKKLYHSMSNEALSKAQQFKLSQSLDEMEQIYREYL